jgi:hypothetical protein
VVGSNRLTRLVLSVIGSFVLGGRDVPDCGVEARAVVPVDVFGGGQFDLRVGSPRAAGLDQLGLVQADRRFISALSRASPTVPTEAAIPASSRCAQRPPDTETQPTRDIPELTDLRSIRRKPVVEGMISQYHHAA